MIKIIFLGIKPNTLTYNITCSKKKSLLRQNQDKKTVMRYDCADFFRKNFKPVHISGAPYIYFC